jgi:hypothetical protein
MSGFGFPSRSTRRASTAAIVVGTRTHLVETIITAVRIDSIARVRRICLALLEAEELET